MTGFWKVFGATALVVGIAVAVAGTLATLALSHAVEAQLDQRIRAETALLAEAARAGLRAGDEPALAALARELSAALAGDRITLLAPDGRPLADSHADPRLMDNHRERPEVLAALRPDNAPRARSSQTVHEEQLYYALAVREDGRLLGFARLSVPLADARARRAEVGRAVLGAGAVALLVGAAAAALLARSVRRPLQELGRYVGAVAQGAEPPPLDRARHGELAPLARSLEAMTRQLHERFERIERDQSEIRAIVGAMVEGVLAIDAAQRVVLLNAAAAELLGTSQDAARGKPVWEVTRAPEVTDLLARCLRTGTPAWVEASLPAAGGERVLRLAASPLADADGTFGSVLVLQDLTGMRRLEAVRRDFVVNVSHELKTPLTAMRGFLDAVLDDPELPEPMRRRFLGRAHEATERMIAIVGDLLSLARVEADGGLARSEALDLRELAGECQGRAAALAALRGAQVQLDLPGEPVPVQGDRAELATALDNLVDNALKYGPPGGLVRVRVLRAGDEATLEVEDRGPGIPAHEQARVWERFYRVDKSRSRDLGGTGLGLSIVRNVAQAHGGRVSLDSEAGRGSVFRLHLPLRIAPAAAVSS